MLLRVQRYSLISMTIVHYEEELGTLRATGTGTSPFKPSSWFHVPSSTRFETIPSSKPVKLAWQDGVFKYTQAIKRSKRPLHPFLNSVRFK